MGIMAIFSIIITIVYAYHSNDSYGMIIRFQFSIVSLGVGAVMVCSWGKKERT